MTRLIARGRRLRPLVSTDSDAYKRRPLRHRLKIAARLLGAAVILVVAPLALRPYLTQNFGVIATGRAYRSSQPTTRLPEMIREHHLASILNLRGGTPAESWYVDEVRNARAGGVDFYDLPLSAVRRPSRRELLFLIDALASAPPPLLIHCRAGADRTGLATVVYNLYVLGLPPEKAMEGFTVLHGHFPILGPQHLHEPIDEYAAWLKAQGLEHEPSRFRGWVRDEYRAPDPSKDPRPITPGARFPV
ncbi:tyrosine-protein phosphatase [Paludisphaera rhizosphaerae]|uniref:tyrosine-protein phosphatase n=1 Tax=Paludisphaera rhizosphaerae TaxID=2711216 RepID=UPI0013ECA9B1|nr:tyrosine-protein phosphatase [Paludisphaera rhizosphaerae]